MAPDWSRSPSPQTGRPARGGQRARAERARWSGGTLWRREASGGTQPTTPRTLCPTHPSLWDEADKHLTVEESEGRRADTLPALPPGLRGSRLQSTHRNPGLWTPSPARGQPPRRPHALPLVLPQFFWLQVEPACRSLTDRKQLIHPWTDTPTEWVTLRVSVLSLKHLSIGFSRNLIRLSDCEKDTGSLQSI